MLMLLVFKDTATVYITVPFQIKADEDPDYSHVPVVTVPGRGFNFASVVDALSESVAYLHRTA